MIGSRTCCSETTVRRVLFNMELPRRCRSSTGQLKKKASEPGRLRFMNLGHEPTIALLDNLKRSVRVRHPVGPVAGRRRHGDSRRQKRHLDDAYRRRSMRWTAARRGPDHRRERHNKTSTSAPGHRGRGQGDVPPDVGARPRPGALHPIFMNGDSGAPAPAEHGPPARRDARPRQAVGRDQETPITPTFARGCRCCSTSSRPTARQGLAAPRSRLRLRYLTGGLATSPGLIVVEHDCGHVDNGIDVTAISEGGRDPRQRAATAWSPAVARRLRPDRRAPDLPDAHRGHRGLATRSRKAGIDAGPDPVGADLRTDRGCAQLWARPDAGASGRMVEIGDAGRDHRRPVDRPSRHQLTMRRFTTAAPRPARGEAHGTSPTTRPDPLPSTRDRAINKDGQRVADLRTASW